MMTDVGFYVLVYHSVKWLAVEETLTDFCTAYVVEFIVDRNDSVGSGKWEVGSREFYSFTAWSLIDNNIVVCFYLVGFVPFAESLPVVSTDNQ